MFNFDNTIFTWTEAILVFFSTLTSDLLWAVYIRRTTEGKALRAAVYSGFIVLLGAIVVSSYIENSWYLFPAIIGAIIGTYIVVRFDKKKDA